MSSSERILVAANGENTSSFDLGDAYLLDPANGTTVAETYSSPASLINTILPNIFMFAGVLLFIFVVVAGFKMVLSPDDKKGAEESKKAIGYAIGGFAVLLGSYWIVQIIEIITGVAILGGQ